MSRAETVPLVRILLARPATPRSRDTRAIRRAVLAAALLAACSGGSDLLLPGDGQPAAIAVVQGDGQSGRVGEPLADPVVVEVTDSRRRPVEGANVAFELTPAGPGAAIVPPTATTDANGQANTRVVLGTTIGAQAGQARVVMGSGDRAPQTSFTATALSENANGIAAVSGDDQTGPAGSTLHDPLVVEVTDAFGNPISGVTINWTAEGGGSVSDASVTTDGQGRASVKRTLGSSAGQQTTLASSEGLAGSPVAFTHTATAGNASSLTIVSGNSQTAAAGTPLPADLVVRLVDAAGNGVSGAAVTWVIGTGGGSVTPENGITDGTGQASAQWTLGPAPGENRVDAVVSGVGIVTFRATGTAGAPAALFIRTQPSSSARNGVRFDRQPVVQIRDAQGNDVAASGIAVTAQIGAGGGDLLGTRQKTTDANGRATFTDLAIAGAPGRRTLVFTASGYGGATSNEIDVTAIATATTITSDLPDPSAPGAAFTVEFRVSSDGPTPTGTVTVTVTDGPATCSGTLQNGAGSCALTLVKEGARTLKATYLGGAGLNPSSDTEDHQVQAPPPQNHAPTADFHWSCDGLTCHFTDASSDPDGSVVSRSWNFGDGATSTDKDPSHTYQGAATYTVALTVTDNGGATGTVSAGVAVNAPPPPQNKAPQAEFEVACPNPDLTCTFTDKSKDDDGNVVSWHWDFGDGQSSNLENPSHSYAAAQTYHVTLTATDNGGASDSKTHDANPKAPPPPPAATTTTITGDGPDPSNPGAPIIVSFTVTSASGIPSGDVTVSEGTDNCTGTLNGSGSGSCSLTLNTAGLGTLTATYPGHSSFGPSTGTEPHTVNAPPTAAFTFDACPSLTCTFTDQSTDDAPIASWSWDFGDPTSPTNTSTEQNPAHLFTAAGLYTVTLTVTDNGALTGTVAHDVTVP